MTTTEFRELVAQGALPSPVKIGNLKRWRVDLLHAVFDAEAARSEEEFTRPILKSVNFHKVSEVFSESEL